MLLTIFKVDVITEFVKIVKFLLDVKKNNIVLRDHSELYFRLSMLISPPYMLTEVTKYIIKNYL